MKMPADLFNSLKTACDPFNTDENRQAYREGRFPRADRVKDLNKRFRWDVFYASRFDSRPLYAADLHDEHIDTALRAIIPTL